MLTDNEIIEGIERHNNHVLSYVYDEMFVYVESYVGHQGGSVDQAKDIFQEAMIIVYKKIVAGKFLLNCKFSTYLYAVCKRIWIQERKKEYLRSNRMKEMSYASEPDLPYEQGILEDAKALFDKHFSKLSPDCQKILLLYFNGLTPEEIRIEMGINTLHHATDKKYRCKKNLIERIKNDPLFRKLKK